MVSTDDFERLARYQAGDLSPAEVTAIEAALATNPELRQALAQLEALDAAAAQVRHEDEQRPVDHELVSRTMAAHHTAALTRRSLALVAGLVLIAGAATVALRSSASHPWAVAVIHPALVNGRTVPVGEQTREAHRVITTAGAVELTLSAADRIIVGEQADVEFLPASRSVVLHAGALIARGSSVKVDVGEARFTVDGEALISRDLFEDTSRVTADLTPEQFVNLKKTSVAVALVGGALALYVVRGTVTVDSPSNSGTRVEAPNRWFGKGSGAVSFADGVAGNDLAPAFATLPDGAVLAPVDGVFEFKVTAGASAEPVNGASIRLYRRASQLAWQTTWRSPVIVETSDGGVATVGAEPGGYYVSVVAPGWPTLEVNDLQRPAGQSLTHVDLRLIAGVTVSGFTADARNGLPVTPAMVTLKHRNAPAAEARTVSVDARGRFSFEGVLPGAWEVEGTAPGVGRAAAHFNTPQNDLLKVSFRPSGFVEGFVTYEDGGVAAGAKVLLVGDDTVEGEASSSGSFSLEAAAGVWRAQAYLGDLVGRSAAEVTARSGQTTSVGTLVLQEASSLSGRVLRGSTGVEGATVEISPHNGDGLVATARSDAAGKYSVRLARGIYDVDAMLDGFSAVSLRGVQVVKKTQLDLVVPPAGRIEGRVDDSKGAPAGGIAVEISQMRKGRQTVITRNDGTYQFEGLQKGNWGVNVRRSGELIGAGALAQVKAGETTRVDLKLEEMGTLRGTVVWRCPGPPQDVRVIVRSTDLALAVRLGPGETIFVPAASPNFEVGMQPGKFNVWVASSHEQCSGASIVTIEPDKVATVVVEAKPKKFDLEVTVRELDGQPAAGALVNGFFGSASGDPVVMLTTDEEGVLRFDLDNEDVNEARSSADSMRSKPVVITASKNGRAGKVGPLPAGTKSVVVTLSEASSALDVTIVGMAEATQATVSLDPLHVSNFFDLLLTTSDHLSVDSVPTGPLVVTVENGNRIGRAEVTIKPGEPAAVTVPLREGAFIKGRIVNAKGAPEAGLAMVTPQGNTSWVRSVVHVNDTGVFEFGPLPAGTYEVGSVSGATKILTVEAGDTVGAGDLLGHVTPGSSERRRSVIIVP